MGAPRVLASFAGLVPLVGLPLAVAAPAVVRGDLLTIATLGQVVVAGIGVAAVWIGVSPRRL